MSDEIFTGENLREAFDKGAEATLEALIEDCKELMVHDDGYEAMKLLDYYITKYYSKNAELVTKVNNTLDTYYEL